MILALTGFSKVGKSTLADTMQDYERVSFADVLKHEVTRLLAANDIEVNLWGKDKEEWRWLLVGWGRMRREQDRNYWIKQLYARIAPLDEQSYVIDDLRYQNELEWVKKHGGLVIGITRPGFKAANDEEHTSIKQLNIMNPDLTWIHNDGNVREMEIALRGTIRQFHTARINKGVYL